MLSPMETHCILNILSLASYFMLEKYLLDLKIYIILTGTYAYLLKPVKNHQSHCVSYKLSKPRLSLRNFPLLDKRKAIIKLALVKDRIYFLLSGKILQLLSWNSANTTCYDKPSSYTESNKEVILVSLTKYLIIYNQLVVQYRWHLTFYVTWKFLNF